MSFMAVSLVSGFLAPAVRIVIRAVTIDYDGASRIAGDVEGGTYHVEQAIQCEQQRQPLDGDTGRQQHGHHQEARARHAGLADGTQGRGDYDGRPGAHAEIDVVDLGEEDGHQTVIDGVAAHVDGGTQRQHEGGGGVGHLQIVLAGLHVDRQGRHGRGGGESHYLRLLHRREVLAYRRVGEEGDQQRVDHEAEDEDGGDIDHEQLEHQGQHVEAIGADGIGHQAEDPDGGNQHHLVYSFSQM